jgi:hypothetical protein
MAKVALKLNSNTKHENEKQEHIICKIKIQKIYILMTYENINIK